MIKIERHNSADSALSERSLDIIVWKKLSKNLTYKGNKNKIKEHIRFSLYLRMFTLYSSNASKFHRLQLTPLPYDNSDKFEITFYLALFPLCSPYPITHERVDREWKSLRPNFSCSIRTPVSVVWSIFVAIACRKSRTFSEFHVFLRTISLPLG